MKKVFIVIVVGALLFLGFSSDGFCRGPRVFIGGYFGFPYYYPYGYYPYYHPYSHYYSYPYPYTYYPYPLTQTPVYVESEQPYYWYYCRDPQGYYPYVTSCPGGWMRVVPAPPPPEREGVVK